MDDIAELVAFAEELHSEVPFSTAPWAVDWMKKATDFASACLNGDELRPFLESAISLRDRGNVRRAAITVRKAGEQFQGTLAAIEASNALTLIIGRLREVRPGYQTGSNWLTTDPAQLDDMLSLASKKAFWTDVDNAIKECSSTYPLALLMMDLDHFKAINDRYGHLAGDEVLTAAAAVVRNVLFLKGKGYRFGGEELVALVPNATVTEAKTTAERIRSGVEVLSFGAKGLKVTVSIGIATCTEGSMEAKSLVEAADKFLYEAKSNGRNRVMSPSESKSKPNPALISTTMFSGEARPTWSRSAFWEITEPFARVVGMDGSTTPINVHEGEHIYLRLIPASPIGPFNPTDALTLVEKNDLRPMTDHIATRRTGRNKYGAFVFWEDKGEILMVTELLKTGELWGIDAYSIEKKIHMAFSGVNFGYIPCTAFEQVFVATLTNYLQFMEHVLKIIPPLKFIAGATRVQGYRMAVPPSRFWKKFDGDFVENDIFYSGTIDSYTIKPVEALRPFFNYVWREAGLDRPNLNIVD